MTEYPDYVAIAKKLLDQQAEINRLRGQWAAFADMMEPITTTEDCLCVDRPHDDHEDEGHRDFENPSCHQQYCPHYLYAYARAMAEGKPTPA